MSTQMLSQVGVTPQTVPLHTGPASVLLPQRVWRMG